MGASAQHTTRSLRAEAAGESTRIIYMAVGFTTRERESRRMILAVARNDFED